MNSHMNVDTSNIMMWKHSTTVVVMNVNSTLHKYVKNYIKSYPTFTITWTLLTNN
jgi:hypothetical protein